MTKNYKLAKLKGIDSSGNEIISHVDTLDININADTINVKDRIETKDINSTGLISGANINASGDINGANVEASGNIRGVNVEATSNVSGNVLNATENVNSSKITTNNLKSKSGSAIETDKLNLTAAAGAEKEIGFIMAENDAAHIKVGGTSNKGYLEIATKDDGTEPIYVKQYGLDGPVRTATLLDSSGNTSFPGTVSAGGKTLATTESVDSTKSTIDNHIKNKDNPHDIKKATIGLGNVDNTSDELKPLSSAAREAFNNVAYTAGQCNEFTADESNKGLTPAAAKKAVTTFGVLKEGNSTITGNLTINGNLHTNSIGVDDLTNIELVGNGNLQDVIDEINTSIEEASTSASDASAKATQAINQINSINQDKISKSDLIFELDSATQTLTIRKNY